MEHTSYETAPEDRVSLSQKILYSLPAVAFIPGMQIVDRVAQLVLNMGLGIDPEKIGLAMMIFRIWDGFTDPTMGNISDNFRSRWGHVEAQLCTPSQHFLSR